MIAAKPTAGAPTSTTAAPRAPFGGAGRTKRRAVRQNSNVFAMFDQRQIAEFKEAFSVIDHDADGFIDKEDLKDMLASLGQTPSNEYIDGMLREAPGSINFTMYLTLMGEKMGGTDPERDILDAFEALAAASSDSAAGTNANAAGSDGMPPAAMPVDDLRTLMTSMGDRFSDAEVDVMLKGVPVDEAGCVRFRDLVRVIKTGEC
ncbi:Myosin regulatory light polypeptide 9 [Cladochytrium tenue]|nr:Myosin regulatory light polypeptide 9 [Cladochytrium tenue]